MSNENKQGELFVKRRDELLKRLGTIDKDIVLQITMHGNTDDLTEGDPFSDWHDNFRDKGEWTKTWGKAGDLAANTEKLFRKGEGNV